MSDEPSRWHFDPVDVAHMRLLARLSPGQRMRVVLAGQEAAREIVLSRLRLESPKAESREIALRLIEELSAEDPEVSAAGRAAARREAERLAGLL